MRLRRHLRVVQDNDDIEVLEHDVEQTWQVVGKLEKRRREFRVIAKSKDEASDIAIQLIEDYFAYNSGKLGNQVWLNGSINLVADDGTTHTVR
jgi:hypothetical protein